MADASGTDSTAVVELAESGADTGAPSGDISETVEKDSPSSSGDKTMDTESDKAAEPPDAGSEEKSPSPNGESSEQPSLKRKLDETEDVQDGENKRTKVEVESGEKQDSEEVAEESEAPADKDKDDAAPPEKKDETPVVDSADKDTTPENEADEKEEVGKADSAKEEVCVNTEDKTEIEQKTSEAKEGEKEEEVNTQLVTEEDKMQVDDSKTVKDVDVLDAKDSDKDVDKDTESGAALKPSQDKETVPVKSEYGDVSSKAVTEPSAGEDSKDADRAKEKLSFSTLTSQTDAAKDSEEKVGKKESVPEEVSKVKTEPEDRSADVAKESRIHQLKQEVKEETPSVKSDGGSDKENQGSDLPVDLSNSGTPDQDVIMLSDEEEIPEPKTSAVDDKAAAVRRRRVKRLQSELRNEEAKLVLLKKLRQSQLAPQIQEHPQMPNANSMAGGQMKAGAPRQQGGPPPLVRGGQPGRAPGMHVQQPQQGRSAMPGQSQSRNMQGPPPLIGAPRSNNTNGHSVQQGMRGNVNMHSMNQHASSSHRALQQQQQQQQQVAQPQQQQQPPQQAATPPQPPVDTQTPAQRQAAAKLALRKQLEKTLLQIPPPKPPAPEMNFIPSLACPDFVLLLGLEEVVNHIIDLQLIARGQKSPDEKFICNPFTCVQCGSDYTPVWKREKPGSKNVICEHCVTWNQKRALKQEHTNRLKSAFVKALQQEQEIERMQAQTLTSTPPAPSPSVTPPAPIVTAPPSALAAAANSVAAAAAMSLNSATYRASAEQVRQHHSFLQQAHQAQLRGQMSGLQGFGPRSPYPYSLPYVKQADLQRQYLLDMIPRAGMPWKP